MKHLEGNGMWVSWAAIVALIATCVTLFDDFHAHFAQQKDIELLQSDVGDCVTDDELTIKLLQFESSLYDTAK